MSEKKRKIYQKWWVWLIVIILILVGISFIFSNEIKAKRLGIDVQYLENPQYCMNQNDCTATINCEPINIYNHNSEDGVCKSIEKGSAGAICYPNGCKIDKSMMGNN